MRKLNLSDKAKRRLKNTGWVFLGMFIAVTMGTDSSSVKEKIVEKRVEVPVEKIVEKSVFLTPQACKDALDIDNQIFLYIGEELPKFNFQGVADFVTAKTPERTTKYQECVL